MFNKENKYTMEEFKKIFDVAMKKVIKEEQEKIKDKDADPMTGLIMGMMTTSSLMSLKQELFGEDTDND